MTSKTILEIRDLSIIYQTKRGPLHAVSDVSFTVTDGMSMALVGESGCGKTTLASAIVQALPTAAKVTGGQILYMDEKGQEKVLLTMKDSELRKILWDQVSMVFQASQSSFNPVKKISTQFYDTIRAHKSMSRKEMYKTSCKLLESVMLDADRVLNAYPHEISGGMKQRALIALSMLLNPRLIILDEPTTALDLLTQQKILDLLRRMRKEKGYSLLFITHDLGIVSELADVVATMYAGHVVEKADVKTFFKNPVHPYSAGLIRAIPRLTTKNEDVVSIPGLPVDLIDVKPGCPFAPRCSRCVEICSSENPTLKEIGPGHLCACWNPIHAGEEQHE